MMADVNEIDLYADDLGEEFNQENEFNENDLYDDVIASSNKGQHDDDYGMNQDNGSIHHHPGQNESSLGGGDGQPSKKIQIYVGNLSWWTTDQDVIDAITELGVNDVMEVKFFENRANGQSKGFCVVTLGSDQSVRSVIEKLGKNEIHGQNPVVTPCNRQNLNHFEMQSRKSNPGLAGGAQHVGGNQQGNFTNRNNFNMQNAGGGPGGPMRQPLIQRPQRPNGPLLGQPRMPMPHQGMGFGQPQGPWNSGGMPPGGVPPRPPAPIHPGAPPMAPMPMMRMPPQGQRGPAPQQPLLRGPNAQGDPRAQMTGGPMQEWGNEHVPPHGPAPQTMGMPQPGPVPGMPVPGGPAPHVNPAFFQPQHHQGPPNSQGDLYGNRMPPGSVNPYAHGDGYGRGPTGMDSGIPQITEQEFEEIMNKNRTVSSTAINRAVADASSGDYSSAIETLVTAISLIRQSKVANDERCKILISSLQDTLHGIEAKSYSSSRTPKDRPRSRERSRERSSRRDKRRDRSRSRERDYRDRSRDRDRYHDDRYHDDRYREKDRDRDHRSRH